MRYLLLINTAGNVILGEIDNGVRMPIGEPLARSHRSSVSSAVWSAEGEWTAWSIDSDSPDGLHEIRLHDEETDTAAVLAESVSAFYMCPSPDGRWLSHLSPGPLGLELALSAILTDELIVVERGQPLFWSWSPDSTKLAVHVENRVLMSGLDGRPPLVLSEEAGSFIAPWWLPGGSVAFSVADTIVCGGLDNSTTTLIAQGASGRFSPDPEGRRIAHVEVVGEGNRLVVVDLLTGDSAVVTTNPVGGFFWSPDGVFLACLVPGGAGEIRWIVFDGSSTVELPPFRPTKAWVSTVLPFFEQYAQSHSHWSNDGRQLVAPAVDADGLGGALVQDVDAPFQSHWMPDAELVWWV